MGLLTLALIIDIFLGDPDWLWRRVPHPVVLFGKLIDQFDELRGQGGSTDQPEGNALSGKAAADMAWGVGLLVVFLAIALLIAWFVSLFGWIGMLVELLIVVVFLAQKSLYDHVARVGAAFKTSGLAGAREAVAMIVGRDVKRLDESGVSKAAIESLAENFSDGVVAPVFWYVVAGLPGIIFFKAVNTADSMIGHRTERHEYFGKPAARLDDWMNWPAARLSTLLIMASAALARGGTAAKTVWSATLRDASQHRSPNAGWPETGFAAALNLSLGGPRNYGADQVDGAYLYAEGREFAKPADIDKALSLFLRCCICLIALCATLGLVFA